MYTRIAENPLRICQKHEKVTIVLLISFGFIEPNVILKILKASKRMQNFSADAITSQEKVESNKIWLPSNFLSLLLCVFLVFERLTVRGKSFRNKINGYLQFLRKIWNEFTLHFIFICTILQARNPLILLFFVLFLYNG